MLSGKFKNVIPTVFYL